MNIKTIYEIDKSIITNLFDDIIFYRGEEYKDEKRVKSIEAINNVTLSGMVQGNRNYVVSITIDEDGDILCDCSCPCDFNCKHAAAILLTWITKKEYKKKSLQQTKKEPIETLDQVLKKKSKEDLIFLITLFIERYPQLALYLHIDVHKLVLKIHRLLYENWDWHNIDLLISELEMILQGIQTNKNQWSNKLITEMKTASQIMIDYSGDIDDNGKLSFFLDEWFLTYGEIVSSKNPTKKQKITFIKTVIHWMEEDDFGLDYSIQQALIGMCNDEQDIDLIINKIKTIEEDNDSCYDDYSELILDLYDKIGSHEKYIQTAIQSGKIIKAIEKSMQLKRFDEALNLCDQLNDDAINLLEKKATILKELKRTKDWHRCLLQLIQNTGQYSYVPQLKQASTKKEWKTYREEIINDAKQKHHDGFLSRLYYDEGNYKEAYTYAKELSDNGYLELLAKKLSKTHPNLSCNILKKLCFDFIKHGSGWPYKKAGSLLKTIKKIDNNGKFFKQTKQQLIQKHKKKYSLMNIIKKI